MTQCSAAPPPPQDRHLIRTSQRPTVLPRDKSGANVKDMNSCRFCTKLNLNPMLTCHGLRGILTKLSNLKKIPDQIPDGGGEEASKLPSKLVFKETKKHAQTVIGISQCIVSSSDLLNFVFLTLPVSLESTAHLLRWTVFGDYNVWLRCGRSSLQRLNSSESSPSPVITGGWFSSSKYHSVQGRTKTNKANSAFEFRTPSEKKKCPFRPGHQLNCRVPPPPPQSTFHR